MANQFGYLFTPLEIGPIAVRNRMVLPAHVTVFGQNHLPTERMAYYLAERAIGFWQWCDTAEFLVEKGKGVTIVTPLPFVGMNLPIDSLGPTYERFLSKKGYLLT